MKTFDEYQEGATTTARYPGQNTVLGLAYAVLGLNGEAGEAGEQVKKMLRDDLADLEQQIYSALTNLESIFRYTLDDKQKVAFDESLAVVREDIGLAFRPRLTDERRDKLVKELGDTLWYAAQIATEIGVPLAEVAQVNADKLAARRAADKIHGEGSER